MIGAELVLRNQECRKFDLLQITTSVEEANWSRCIAEIQDYSAVGLPICRKTSNDLISYGNGPSGIRRSKGMKDRDVYKDVCDEWMVALSTDRELVHGSTLKWILQNDRGL